MKYLAYVLNYRKYLTKQFLVVELFHDMHMFISKAAKLTECTEKAFECRLARAHRKLQQILISEEVGEI